MEGSRLRLQVLVRNIVKDNALAEDIVQDAILAGLQAVREGKSISSPEAWLMRVARNKALDAVRSTGYSKAAPLEAVSRQEGATNLELHLGMRERIKQVREVVQEQLPEQQRSAFILRDVLGYGMDEIASVLCVNESNARQLVSRARKKIREYLLENE